MKSATENLVLEPKKSRGRPRKDTSEVLSDAVGMSKTTYKSSSGAFNVVLDVTYGKKSNKVEVFSVDFFKSKDPVSMGYMIQKKGRKRIIGLIKKAMWKAKVRDFSLSFELQAVLEQE